MVTVPGRELATGNPYWEKITTLPVIGGSPAPGSTTAARDLAAAYAWAIPSPGDIQWMITVLNGRGVVEAGAGGGYWALMLTQAGADVIAYDPQPRGGVWAAQRWFPVRRGTGRAAAWHPARALFLCWPGIGARWAARALTAYRGDLLLFCGQGRGGATCDDRFYDLLDAGWARVSTSPAHLSFAGAPDELAAYRRAGLAFAAAEQQPGRPR